ncbi:hypothetical protein FOB58_003010 [Candida parapsilosis]|uniref:Uncharacterized protein n=2 Tax=Candida parapsilosis TaxID=5480 RepID=G8B788_CANPC|nr:uncharacterized protein CPAR2_103590 [Candida parapsilosis]KAF6048301.1 hypothetical protein FOB59_003343 [Candida parapsilosis]KAF6049733.1 hypothetical protein FOB58_003010 [Candida parapsilosis]KAF6057595.1 hypothetical protein FOB60_002150 [Candida parapsilosis]KAF6065697.1 hypothetical protein FOB61_001767 [Candida parapsilosis]KAI5904598.1 hypothetical protein K4G60_g3756 [Candida parapsilosis]
MTTHQSQNNNSRFKHSGSTNSKNGSNSHKWINQLRTLPSNPQSKDFLKLEYLDVNLNNSRKLITNLNALTKETSDYVKNVDLQVNGNLVQLNQVEKELAWLD